MTVRVEKLTPVLIVERIEPVLGLWERLGFTRKAAVPDESGALVFVLLEQGSLEVMLQTAASLELPQGERTPSSVLYMDVPSLAETLGALGAVATLKEPHATFYGTREVTIRDASGQILTFAEHTSAGASS